MVTSQKICFYWFLISSTIDMLKAHTHTHTHIHTVATGTWLFHWHPESETMTRLKCINSDIVKCLKQSMIQH